MLKLHKFLTKQSKMDELLICFLAFRLFYGYFLWEPYIQTAQNAGYDLNGFVWTEQE